MIFFTNTTQPSRSVFKISRFQLYICMRHSDLISQIHQCVFMLTSDPDKVLEFDCIFSETNRIAFFIGKE